MRGDGTDPCPDRYWLPSAPQPPTRTELGSTSLPRLNPPRLERTGGTVRRRTSGPPRRGGGVWGGVGAVGTHLYGVPFPGTTPGTPPGVRPQRRFLPLSIRGPPGGPFSTPTQVGDLRSEGEGVGDKYHPLYDHLSVHRCLPVPLRRPGGPVVYWGLHPRRRDPLGHSPAHTHSSRTQVADKHPVLRPIHTPHTQTSPTDTPQQNRHMAHPHRDTTRTHTEPHA